MKKPAEGRLRYKPGYSFRFTAPFAGRSSLMIESDTLIPDTADPRGATMRDLWEDPNVDADVTMLEGAAVVALSNALECAIHEVLEWFSVDDRRLLDAHHTAVMNKSRETAQALAAWCWRKRRAWPGQPYPPAFMPKDINLSSSEGA